ncbi:MAG: adenosine deaminase [Roseivirga sp.]
MTLITTCKTAPKNAQPSAILQVNQQFEKIKGDPVALREFLWKMPKGGDIHHHALGSVFAEDYLDLAIEKKLFINPHSYQLYFDETDALSKRDEQAIAIHQLIESDPKEKENIIDHWSVRNHRENGRNGHHWFFATFQKFEPAMIGNEPWFLSKLCKAAARENVQYLETMVAVPSIVERVGRQAKAKTWAPEISMKDHLLEWLRYLEAQGIDQWATYNAEVMDHWAKSIDTYGVTLRFQTVGLRIIPEMEVLFAHLLLAFKTALISDNVVGVNFVAPEDHAISLSHYSEHMAMFHFLRDKYPQVNLSLHAGELSPGKGDTQSHDMTYHIDEAITVAGAQRIGHGIDIHSETRHEELLTIMRKRQIAIELSLESNAVILETTPNTHPLKTYIEAGVPVCIASDDAGILRSDLTRQYEMLVEYYPELSYEQLREIVMNSIRYSFLNSTEKSGALERLEEAFQKFETQ